MACGARSGLKRHYRGDHAHTGLRLNGLWSPFGIETRTVDEEDAQQTSGYMACGLRAGLKRGSCVPHIHIVFVGKRACGARSVLHLAQGLIIEQTPVLAKWPVEPVRD